MRTIQEIKTEISNLEFFIHFREESTSGTETFASLTLFELYQELDNAYKELNEICEI